MPSTAREFWLIGWLAVFWFGLGGHWFITPTSHPDASAWRSAGVAGEMILSVALFLWASLRAHALGVPLPLPLRPPAAEPTST